MSGPLTSLIQHYVHPCNIINRPTLHPAPIHFKTSPESFPAVGNTAVVFLRNLPPLYFLACNRFHSWQFLGIKKKIILWVSLMAKVLGNAPVT